MRRITYLLALPAMLSAANPSPATPAETDARVEKIMGKLSVEQKIDMLGGVDGFFVRGFEEYGFPRLRMADGPVGVRNFGPSTAYAAGIGLAASWDPQLAQEVGKGIGEDARAKGVHFMLGPGVNIYRTPVNGRNFEYFGEDPFLAARTSVGYIQGIQSQGVIATVKHFMGNNSEFLRHDSNSQIDERTQREIYLPAFEASVKEAKVGSIMDSYNLINGEHASQNSRLNNDIAKKEWGFRGIIMSDWDATYDAVGAVNGGLDLEMPYGKFLNRKNLLPALKDGRIKQATIDDKVRRIIRTAAEFGFLDRDQLDLTVPRFSEARRATALKGAEEGTVLLKNEGVLPLDRKSVHSIAVLGPCAYPAAPVAGGSAAVQPFSAVSGLEAISAAFPGAKIFYDRGIPSLDEVIENTRWNEVRVDHFGNDTFAGEPTKTSREMRVSFFSSEAVDWAAIMSGATPKGQSLRYTTSYQATKTGPHRWFVNAVGGDAYKLIVDGKVIAEHAKSEGQGPVSVVVPLEAGKAYPVSFELAVGISWGPNKAGVGVMPEEDLVSPLARKLAAQADVALVMAGFDASTESEGFDRTFGLPGGQDALIQAVSGANKKTIVALTAGGAVDVAPWVDGVPALLHNWYPGQEGARALAGILAGDVNPSGRLPISWEAKASDNPVFNSYGINNGDKNIKYNEGIFVGYRGFEKNGVKPRFPFGYGLSYTTFAYKNLKITPAKPRVGQEVVVSFDMTNTGAVAGADVAQLYVGHPTASVPRPLKELKGFSRVVLNSGETKHVTLTLDGRAMSYYDVPGKGWKQEPGTYTVQIGRSSADITLKSDCVVTK
ncbi:MAG TPA: glycoside hydrolase family 3 C-terminal domain-containing protein [Holophaga sp.]|nr:glycoside hydrolase family 3 C-terminal domain-containing protein [Holophaga sp.]